MATLQDRIANLISAIGADIKALSAAQAASKDSLLPVTHETSLNYIRASLSDANIRPVHVTVVADSIGWGVGSDGLTAQTTPWDPTQEATYRQAAWPVQLSALLNNGAFGFQPAQGWFGPSYTSSTNGGGWQAATATGAVTQSTTAGPFGAQASAQRGGAAIGQTSGVPGTVTWSASVLGSFTELLVEYYGTDAGVASPVEPQVQVDGVTVYMPTSDTPAGVLNRVRITGLSDAPHSVAVLNPLVSGRTVYCTGVIVTRSNGIVVNRVCSAGATTSDAAAPSYTAIQQQRVIEPLTKPGLTDLLIIALGTNDYGNQIAISTYSSNLAAIAAPVLAAGGAVLLFGGPTPRNAAQNTITEQMYDDAAAALANSTPRMAYLSVRNLLQSRTIADNAGLFSASTSVHPSRRGHNMYAKALQVVLRRPIVPGSESMVIPGVVRGGPTPVTTGQTTQTLRWPAVTGADRYLVERQTALAGSWTTVVDTDLLTATATGLTASTKYSYRITARNQVGTGAVSPSAIRTTTA